jgi:signal transduction histidine kinase/ActR/RegA family two-component response regulator
MNVTSARADTAALNRGREQPLHEREVFAELVNLHARALLRMPWVQCLLVCAIWVFVHGHVGTWRYVTWGAITVGVEALRAARAWSVLRTRADRPPRRTHAGFVGLAILSGAAVGLGAILLLPQLPLLDQALFGAILFAVPAAGVAVSQSSPQILAAYSLSMLLPAAVVWGRLHPTQATALFALTLLYSAVLILVSADGARSLRRSVIIRHERDRLVGDLERRNTDVQQAVQQAQRVAQTHARVLAAASHDLRQPLNALSVYSAVLAANPTPAMLREVGQNMDQLVRALGSLLNGLLDLSRLSVGDIALDRQPVLLDRVAAELAAEFEGPAQSKGLRMCLMLQPVHICGDPVAVARIARNLIDNAVKYTTCGDIGVATLIEEAGAERYAVLSVSDTGKGIPADEYERIFEEFYQLDNPGRDRNRGVGLGLAIVRRLAELMSAKVEIQSKFGQGTTFRVRFPYAGAAAEEVRIGVDPAGAAGFDGERVYIVDDETDILHSMRTLLGIWGLSASTADSASALEELFGHHGRPDLLLLDLRLRGHERGTSLAQRLQRLHGSFAVLVITGETATEELAEARACGWTVLQKPIAPENLRRAVAEALHAAAGSE